MRYPHSRAHLYTPALEHNRATKQNQSRSRRTICRGRRRKQKQHRKRARWPYFQLVDRNYKIIRYLLTRGVGTWK